MRKALAVSFAAHGAFLALFVPIARRAATAEAAPLAPPVDRWSGTTAELPFAGGAPGPLVDVSVDRAPAPPPAQEAPPQPKDAAPAPVKAAPEPAPRKDAAPAIAAPAKAVAGPRRDDRNKELRKAEPRDAAAGEAPERPAPRRKKAPVIAGGGDGSAAKGAAPPGSFGAEGPASVRDLGRALTRAIPPACDSDPVWATLPAGDAGKLEVAVRVDAEGHIASAEPRGAAQPKALVNVLRRTVPLLQAGTFALRDGASGEGTEILELSATVQDPSGEEDGDTPNRLAFEYARGRGRARFTQASGRRVEIAVRVVRIEAPR